jgi:dipeptidyl aminopeptidase/acylaminoacyl peptidase
MTLRPPALRRLLPALLSLAGIASPAAGAVTIQDLVTLAEPSDVAISRDGKQIAWTSTVGNLEDNEERSRIWLWRQASYEGLRKLGHVITGAEPPKAYRAVTREEDDADSPAFSPDGKSLAFLAARGEDAKVQVWVLPLDGGEAEARTDSGEDVDSFAWMPDGGLIYLASEPWPDGVRQWREDRKEAGFDTVPVGEDRRPKAFWRVPPGGGGAERVFLGGPGIDGFALSWSGKSLVYHDNGTGDPSHWNEFNLYRLDLDRGAAGSGKGGVRKLGGKGTRANSDGGADGDAGGGADGALVPVQLTFRWGDEWDPQWSNDDATLFFLSGADSMKSFSQVRIFSMPSSGGAAPRPLFTELDRDIDTFRSMPRDNRLFATVIDGTRVKLVKLFPNTQSVRPIVDGAGSVQSLAVAEGGEDVAFVQEGPGQAPEVCRWQFDNRSFERLTDENADVTTRADAEHRIVHWTARDGLALEGILVTPPEAQDARPQPTVVLLHGGPASVAFDTVRWSTIDAMAARGYVIFAPNYRGSQGYGAAFNVADYRDLGGADFRDVMTGVDSLVARGIADPARLGVTGASYGGFLTNMAVASTDRFAAAVSELGIASWVTDSANSDERAFEHDYFGVWFWEDPELYERLSPLARVDRIVTPTLILHGEDDTNTRPANSRELFGSMLEAGKAPVELVLYPREGHGFDEPAHRVDEFERMMGWFDHYLLGLDPAKIGRVGAAVGAGDWHLLVRSAEQTDEIGGEKGPWLVVDLVLTSDARVEGRDLAVGGPRSAFRLVTADGTSSPPEGIETESNGAAHLVKGDLHMTLTGDPARDTASWSLRIVFDAAGAVPPARFRALELPETELRWTVNDHGTEESP